MAGRCQVPPVGCQLPSGQAEGWTRQVLALAETSGSSCWEDGGTGRGGSCGSHFYILPAAPSLARKSLRGPVSHPQLPVLLLNGPQVVTQGPQESRHVSWLHLLNQLSLVSEGQGCWQSLGARTCPWSFSHLQGLVDGGLEQSNCILVLNSSQVSPPPGSLL